MRLSRCFCCSKICAGVIGKEQVIIGLWSKLFSLKKKIPEELSKCVCFKCYLRLKLCYAYRETFVSLCDRLRKTVPLYNVDIPKTLNDMAIISHCPVCFANQPSIRHIYQHLSLQQDEQHCNACGNQMKSVREHYNVSPKCAPVEYKQRAMAHVYYCTSGCGAFFERRQLYEIHQTECKYGQKLLKGKSEAAFDSHIGSASNSPNFMDYVETDMVSTPDCSNDVNVVAKPATRHAVSRIKRGSHGLKAQLFKVHDPFNDGTKENSFVSQEKGRKKFCTVCNKWVRSIEKHLLTHNFVRSNECKHCHKTFKCAPRAWSHEEHECPQRMIPPSTPDPKKTLLDEQATAVQHESVNIKRTPAPEGKSYKQCCYICGKWVNKLKQHLLVHNSDKQCECMHCHKLFKSTISLKGHKLICPPHQITERTDTDGQAQSFTCDICHKSFVYDALLKRHMNLHIKFPCPVCNVLISKASKRVHMTMVHDNVSVVCDLCGKVQKNRCVLSAHIRKHHRDDAHLPTCDKCGKKFKDLHQLKVHSTSHDVGHNEHSCETCGLRFFTFISLQNHIRSVHKKTTSRDCSVCGLTLSSLNTLKVHERQHTGVKPYVCDICGKAFTQRPPLNRHKRTQHGIMPPLVEKCPHCDKMFPSKAVLKSHIVKVH